MVVVFPDPLGPRKPCTPPRGTARSRSSTATRVPARPLNSLRSPLVSITRSVLLVVLDNVVPLRAST